MRTPVVDSQGVPLMPCHPAKARRLLSAGKAHARWSKLAGTQLGRTRTFAFGASLFKCLAPPLDLPIFPVVLVLAIQGFILQAFKIGAPHIVPAYVPSPPPPPPATVTCESGAVVTAPGVCPPAPLPPPPPPPPPTPERGS